MTDPHFSPAGEQRRVWLFSLDLPEEEVKAFAEEQFNKEGASTGWPLRDALGVVRLDKDYVEVFKTDTFSDYGLDRYLTEAHGMSEAQVAADAEKLKGLNGHAVLVVSKAFGGRAAQFNPSDKLTLIGSYEAEKPTAAVLKLEAKAAKQQEVAEKKAEKLEKRREKVARKQSDASIGGRVALLVLLVLFVLVGAMIQISG